MSTVSLTKGEAVDLTKVAPSLTKLIAGAGWDAKVGKKIDLDLFTVYLGSDGKAIPDENGNGSNKDEALCFFNNQTLPGMKHSGDNRTGEGEGDDEQIVLTLADVPANVVSIAVVVAIYNGAANLGEVENVKVRMVNAEGNEELAQFTVADGLASAQGVLLGHVKKDGSNWSFVAEGTALSGTFNSIVSSFGLN
jgi:tellurium resistance protein TerD